MKVTLTTIIVISIIFVFIGSYYQNTATINDMKNFPPPGKMVEVNGLKYHLNCMGSGRPTVILEAGLGESSLSWFPIQSEISKMTQVCAYDRAGLGWSEGSRERFPLNRVSTELHKLLEREGVKPPYIMVGHSRGGIYVRNFYHQFTNDVAGMVLVDSTHEQSLALQYPHNRLSYIKQKIQIMIAIPLSISGVIRLAGWADADRRSSPLPKNIIAAKTAVQNRTSTARAIVNEIKVMREGLAANTQPPLSLGSLPLVVLTAGGANSKQISEQGILAKIDRKLQNELAALSSNSQHIIVTNSGHFIMYDQPVLVISYIKEMVKIIR